MTSKRRLYRHPRPARWWDDPPREWKPWITGAVIIILLGIMVYACSSPAGAEPAKRWDLYHWIWPERPAPSPQPPMAPPVVVAPVPPPPVVVAPPPPVIVPPPGPQPLPVPPVPPPSIFTPVPAPEVLPPPLPPAPPPTFKQKATHAPNVVKPPKPKPKQPRQQTTEPETNEYLPPCSLVCWYSQGKTRAQLESEARSRNPTARMRRHALACLAGCGK